MEGKLTVTVHGAGDLTPHGDVVGKNDPYCLIRLGAVGKREHKTKVIQEGGTDVSWEETFSFDVDAKTEKILHIMVKDEDVVSDDALGRADLSLDKVLLSQPKTKFELVNPENFKVLAGWISLTATFEGTGGPRASVSTTTTTETSASTTTTPTPTEGSVEPLIETKAHSSSVVMDDKEWETKKLFGNLTITVHGCKGLPSADLFSKNDPYCSITIGKRTTQTPVVDGGGADPTWDYSLLYKLTGHEKIVHLKVKDKDTASDDTIARLDYKLRDMIKNRGRTTYRLISNSNFKKMAGTIDLTFSFSETGTAEYQKVFERENKIEKKEGEELGFTSEPALLIRATSENFDTSHDFDWDWCLIFNIGVNNVKVKNMTQQKYFRLAAGKIVDKLLESGLKILLYKAQTQEQVICLVAASEERLKIEAYRVEYNLELDRDELITQGRKYKMKLAEFAGKALEGNREFSEFAPEMFESIYGSFVPNDSKHPDREQVYRKYKDEGAVKSSGGKSFFRQIDRIKLTKSIIEAESALGGAGLRLARHLGDSNHPLTGVFPIHKVDKRAEIQAMWLKKRSMFQQPVDKIRHYYGEQIAYYFGFLQFYSRMLVIPALWGLITYIWQLASGKVEVEGFGIFGIMMAIWATLFLEFWKRRQNELACRWGMADFKEKEQPRPEFRGTIKPSPIDGALVELYPFYLRVMRSLLSHSVIVTLIGVVIACVTGIFFFRKYVIAWNSEVGGYFVSFINAIQIMILNIVYSSMALKLNDFENHRTQSDYMNGLITKSFLFKFVNSYNTLFYIAFLKQYDNLGAESCPDNNCLPELRKQLGTIFVTTLVVNNLVEVLKPIISNKLKLRAHERQLEREEVDDESPAEHEYTLAIYDSTFEDFDEIVVQYGYCTLFVAAFPLAPLASLISIMLEIQIDTNKLCKYTRRPVPSGACNIGTWYEILNIVSFIAVVTNIAIILFSTANDPEAKDIGQYDMFDKFIFFIVCEHVILSIKFIAAYLIPDVPAGVLLHLKRQEYITNILIWGADVPEEIQPPKSPDELPEDETSSILKLYDLDRIPNSLPKKELERWKTRAAVGATYLPPEENADPIAPTVTPADTATTSSGSPATSGTFDGIV